MKFNRTLEYGTVYGHPDVSYEQGGHYFKSDGTEVDMAQVHAKRDAATSEQLSAAVNNTDAARKRLQQGA